VNIATLLLFAVCTAAAALLYRRHRSQSLPSISDDQFLYEFFAHHAVSSSTADILKERRRIARALGISPEKLTPGLTFDVLSDRLSFLTDFSVAWNDLIDEAEESRERAQLKIRDQVPSTIGEIMEDTLNGGPL
jgi:hypothetical protein